VEETVRLCKKAKTPLVHAEVARSIRCQRGLRCNWREASRASHDSGAHPRSSAERLERLLEEQTAMPAFWDWAIINSAHDSCQATFGRIALHRWALPVFAYLCVQDSQLSEISQEPIRDESFSGKCSTIQSHLWQHGKASHFSL